MTSEARQRVAIVTGAGQGLGRAVAVALSGAGIAVAAVGRTAAKLRETCALLPGEGLAVAADLTAPNEVRDAFRQVEERFGGIDVLINCHAEYTPFRIDEASDEQITSRIANSLTSAIFCMREAIIAMRRRGGGDIVNITTQSVALPQPFMLVYAGARAAVETISQGLRFELQGEDYRIIVCQVGIVAETVAKPGFDAERARIDALWEKTGIAQQYIYPGSSASGIAAAIVHAVCAPRDMYQHLIQIRGNGPAA